MERVSVDVDGVVVPDAVGGTLELLNCGTQKKLDVNVGNPWHLWNLLKNL